VHQLSKTQVDRLGDRLRSSPLDEADVRMLDQYRRSFSSAYEIVVRSIRDELTLEPTGRPAKSTSAITEKLQRESIRLSQIQDIAGCRIVVADVIDQDQAVKALLRLFPDARVMDRRKAPSHGYRAVHVIPFVERKAIEVQIRTSLQHLWSEVSEKLSDLIDPSVKYGGGSEEVRSMLLKTSEFVGQIEKSENELVSIAQQVGATNFSGEIDQVKREILKMKADLSAMIRDISGDNKQGV